MYLLWLWVGKIVQKISRLFHNSGAALPGFIIERVYPQFLEKALGKLSDGVVVISGTNGKTTTTKIVSETLSASGERVLTNRSGSNMTRGLMSTVVGESRWYGKLPYGVAVLEVDEAYASVLSKRVPIRAALVLNVMRDQLDRFGEIDTTAKYLSQLTATATDLVVLNANDSRVNDLPSTRKSNRVTFGADSSLLPLLKSEDQWHDESKPKAVRSDFTLELSSGFELKISGEDKVESRLEGVHNHLNFVAAFGLLANLKPEVTHEQLLELMCRVGPAFGRGERVEVGESIIDILLVKNPSSFMQTVKSSKLADYSSVSLVINDAIADGRDVSWLWDIEVADFKKAKKLLVCGTRRYDMTNRLKYGGISAKEVIEDESKLVSRLSSTGGTHAVFCTYTAMLAIRKQLVRTGRAEVVR